MIGKKRTQRLHSYELNGIDSAIQIMGGYESQSNITRIKELASEIYQTQIQYEQFFELSPDLLCISTEDGRFIKVNSSWEKMIGFTKAEIYEMGWQGLLDRSVSTDRSMSAMTNDGLKDFENVIIGKDGKKHLILWHTSPWVDGVSYCIGREITNLKKNKKI